MIINKYLDSLELSSLSRKFADFLVDYFGCREYSDLNFVIRQLYPWFNSSTEESSEFDQHIHSQFYAEYVHQKYRLALEFCALEAGIENVVVYDPDTLLPISGGVFWFRDCHPDPVKWVMLLDGRCITRGEECANTLNKDTLEEWLLNRILDFSTVKKACNN